MYVKGDWAMHQLRRRAMRVQRDQKTQGAERRLVWCEWQDGAYHLEAFDEDELAPLPRAEWPADL